MMNNGPESNNDKPDRLKSLRNLRTVEADDTSPNPSAAAVAGATLRASEKAILDNVEIVARVRFAAFQAYRSAGFNEKQALELCTK